MYVEHLLKLEKEREEHLIQRRTRGKRQRSPEPQPDDEPESTAPKPVAEYDDETDAPRITKRHRSEKLPTTTKAATATPPAKNDK